MKLASALITFALAAATQAAPAGSRLDCRQGRSGKLTVYSLPGFFSNETSQEFAAFSEQHMDGKYLQLAKAPNNQTEQTFTYYKCAASTRENGKGGQLRSDKHPDLCMTIKAIDNKDAINGYDYDHGHLSLRPCATSASDKLFEQQWFMGGDGELRSEGKKDSGSQRSLAWFDDNDLVTLFSDPTSRSPSGLELI